ncbi:MAG: YraN family protein [Betaproteobacteria bacterium]|nr:YraN family protein [Betaproteobacteria bacterium]
MEERALQYLQGRGLALVERQARYPFGEIDLVMMEGDEVVFVEVRYRASRSFGGALASVGRAKQRRLRLAALAWLSTAQREASGHGPAPRYKGSRFDLVLIEPGELQWLRNAI